MSMGIPIVCNDGVGDVGTIMSTCNAGILLPNLEDASLRNGVKQILTSSFPKEEIKDAAMHFYSLKQGVKQYDEIYSSL